MQSKSPDFSFGTSSGDDPEPTVRDVRALELEPPPQGPGSARAFNPYDRDQPATRTGNTTRTDLRKLSEWIRLKKELEERRARGESAGDEPVQSPPAATER